jgi:hypothetical protein
MATRAAYLHFARAFPERPRKSFGAQFFSVQRTVSQLTSN